MITINVEYNNNVYPILYHEGEFFQMEHPSDVKYKLLSYFVKLWRTTGYLSTGECVVCYEENQIGSLMGCCNFKHFLCVGCYSAMYQAFKFGCPCCRENMFIPMADRMANQLTWYQRESNLKNGSWAHIFNEQKRFYSSKIKKVIRELKKLGLDEFSEEDLEYTPGYDDETHSTYLCIIEEQTEYFWNKRSPIHFNKIQRKVGYKPINLARMGGKMRTVME